MNVTLFEFGNKSKRFLKILTEQIPSAEAAIRGDRKHAVIRGTVSFFETNGGVLVATEVSGLPTGSTPCESRVLGFHIHSGGNCSGSAADPFADAGSHYNPNDCLHPHHAGDMPPLFSCNGFAWSVFYTDRFTIEEILEKTVIVHDSPDDFTTQPSGHAGNKIACGIIHRNLQK